MPANKMPEMPEPTWEGWYSERDMAEHGEACDYSGYQRGYRAGLEAARGCVLADVERLRNVIDTCFLDEADMDDLIKAADNIAANLEALKNESVADKSADALGRE